MTFIHDEAQDYRKQLKMHCKHHIAKTQSRRFQGYLPVRGILFRRVTAICYKALLSFVTLLCYIIISLILLLFLFFINTFSITTSIFILYILLQLQLIRPTAVLLYNTQNLLIFYLFNNCTFSVNCIIVSISN